MSQSRLPHGILLSRCLCFFFNYINLCMCVHMFDIAHIKKSEHSFWESFIPFYHVCPWFQRRSPGLAASTFSHSAI